MNQTFWNRRTLSMMPSYLNVAIIHELERNGTKIINAYERDMSSKQRIFHT